MPIDPKQFKAGGITSTQLAPGAVTAGKIGTGAVGSTEIADGSVAAGDLGSQVAVKPDASNTDMIALVTTADGDLATNTTIAAAFKGALRIDVNGISYPLGNGSKTSSSAYISGDNGVTARSFNAVAIGDKIFWVGSVAGFQLAASDLLSVVGAA